jgi:hypothetical protein
MRMAIKVHFSAGETTKRTSALYQWDYGQQLEIESADLPTLVEVHFACPDMSEAIVRVCSVNNGIALFPFPIYVWNNRIQSQLGYMKSMTPQGLRPRPLLSP